MYLKKIILKRDLRRIFYYRHVLHINQNRDCLV